MANALILFFEVKAGIDAHLIKEEWSEWNNAQADLVHDQYYTNWWRLGRWPKRRPVIYSILLFLSLLLLNLCYTEFNYPRDVVVHHMCYIFRLDK